MSFDPSSITSRLSALPRLTVAQREAARAAIRKLLETPHPEAGQALLPESKLDAMDDAQAVTLLVAGIIHTAREQAVQRTFGRERLGDVLESMLEDPSVLPDETHSLLEGLLSEPASLAHPRANWWNGDGDAECDVERVAWDEIDLRQASGELQSYRREPEGWHVLIDNEDTYTLRQGQLPTLRALDDKLSARAPENTPDPVLALLRTFQDEMEGGVFSDLGREVKAVRESKDRVLADHVEKTDAIVDEFAGAYAVGQTSQEEVGALVALLETAASRADSFQSIEHSEGTAQFEQLSAAIPNLNQKRVKAAIDALAAIPEYVRLRPDLLEAAGLSDEAKGTLLLVAFQREHPDQLGELLRRTNISTVGEAWLEYLDGAEYIVDAPEVLVEFLQELDSPAMDGQPHEQLQTLRELQDVQPHSPVDLAQYFTLEPQFGLTPARSFSQRAEDAFAEPLTLEAAELLFATLAPYATKGTPDALLSELRQALKDAHVDVEADVDAVADDGDIDDEFEDDIGADDTGDDALAVDALRQAQLDALVDHLAAEIQRMNTEYGTRDASVLEVLRTYAKKGEA